MEHPEYPQITEWAVIAALWRLYSRVVLLKEEPQVGDVLILEDMMHYTTVKTTMFNGIQHPSIYLHHESGEWELLRAFEYADYKNRMD